MINEWKAFLENAGAVLENDVVTHFGNSTVQSETATTANHEVMADLSHLGLIRAHGNDAQTFLQGQLTGDVREVGSQHSQLSGYCSPKGRLLAVLRLFFYNDSYYLQLPREILPTILKRLGMFVLMSKVTLEDSSEFMAHIGLSGPKSEHQLKNIIGQLPLDVDQVLEVDKIIVIRIAGVQPRFEIYGTPAELQRVWEKLSNSAVPVGSAAWRRLDVLAGIPAIYTDTMDAFVPQMVNLETLGGISFKKGCYTGQEVVARLHYRGNLKRRMYLAHVDTPSAPQAGDTLFSPDASDAESTGIIVDAQPSTGEGYDVLAVIRIPYAESSEVRLSDAQGGLLQFLELPYQHVIKDNNI